MQIQLRQGGGYFEDRSGSPINGRPSESMECVMGFWLSPHLPLDDKKGRCNTRSTAAIP